MPSEIRVFERAVKILLNEFRAIVRPPLLIIFPNIVFHRLCFTVSRFKLSEGLKPIARLFLPVIVIGIHSEHQHKYSSCEYFCSEIGLQLARVKKTRESKFKNVVGQRVRRARMAMLPAVSQEDLSGKLARVGVQITQTSISKIENRSRYVMDYEALALARVLKVSVAWLYGERDQEAVARKR